MVSHIVFPDAFKNCAISPNHFTFSVTLTLPEFSMVLCLFELASSASLDGVFVVDLTVAIRSSILVSANELVTIHKGYAAPMLQPTIDDAT